jgi:hypothetical protein
MSLHSLKLHPLLGSSSLISIVLGASHVATRSTARVALPDPPAAHDSDAENEVEEEEVEGDASDILVDLPDETDVCS